MSKTTTTKRGIFRNKKRYRALILFFVLTGLTIAWFNIDLILRAEHSLLNGTLTMEKFRLDLASYDISQIVPPIPSDAKKNPKDGMIQVYVPEGEFTMGIGSTGNSPSHLVYLDAFWMDRIEVTNSMYLKCMRAGICSKPASENITYDTWAYRNHPAVYITWFQASEYCQWAGRRLPTEAEWEKAARGTDKRSYPWGFDQPTARLANFEDTMIHEAVPSNRYPLGASPYGVLNMSGNAREWVADWFDPHYYYSSPFTNPKGPDTGNQKSLRSGSYNEDLREIAVYRRYSHEPQSAGLSRGFRCAQSSSLGD